MKRKIEAHRTLWSVVKFHNGALGTGRLAVRGCTLHGLFQTKQEAEEVAAKIKGAFVLPPKSAWAGKESALVCEEKAS